MGAFFLDAQGRAREMVGTITSPPDVNSHIRYVLKERILATYTEHYPTKKLTQQEYDSLMELYKQFKARSVNDESYIDLLIDNLKSWTIIQGGSI